ncbi:probable sucrose-phosphate synthase 1 [Rhododendron vialii]|uniref:probable sucrose-phosphate synthase 1 n=1 Tax=Rhododendron vialii TaxID=182163 RepID=UPI00265FA8E6|nr:probable sucrose-phosphate synthase 1 [Rhododendron vialii]
MAGNDWINSYLEAILDVGPPLDDPKSSLLLRERGRFSPTRYFVEEVITGFDETDLHRSWVQASAIRDSQERNTRLENMCWRIWNLARKKKQLEGEEAQCTAKWRVERERGRREATADMSEDLSEGEKGDLVSDIPTHGGTPRGRMHRIHSVDAMENWANQQKEKKLYIVLISLHGLIRGENMELGRDSDTGGQVKYVVELARALGAMPGVYRVDLLTRQVATPDVDWSYGEPTEMLSPLKPENDIQTTGESGGAYIVRIPFGPKDKYISKELLWPHIPEFVDGALGHIIQMSKVLGEQIGGGEPVWPVAIHGHYADAGDSAALLSGALNVPMLLTGHSLGRDKLEQLLKQGRQSREEVNATYRIMRRIEAEELSLDASDVVITSTRQEIEEQWRLYDGFDPVLERKLRARIKRNVSCYGRFMPRMVVIPPGMEFHHIVPHDADMEREIEGDEDNPASPDPPVWSEIMRFFSNPRKPMILALARPDPKKNVTTLVKAFGECKPLRELANLTLIMGNRDAIDEMSSTNASVLLSILKLIDKYDLYGQVAYPKHHKQHEVADIYRLAAKTKGVFINPAFIEPFGLTLIEAAAHGLPIVATKNGGPVDINKVLDNGLLVDPHDQQSIADALLKLVSNKQLWARCRQNGLNNIHLFSWPEHCKTYLSRITSCKPRKPQWQKSDDGFETSESDSPGDSLRDIKDLSLNLKLSLDGEKIEGSGTFDNALGSEENATDGNSRLVNAVLELSKDAEKNPERASSIEKADSNMSKSLTLRRRKFIFVISLDFEMNSDFLDAIKVIVEAAAYYNAGSIGFILSTASSISEIISLLESGGLSPMDFDAFICNSGSELYYPSSNSEGGPSGLPVIPDFDYHSHIGYRWGGEGLRKTLVRWAANINEKKGANGEQIVEAESGSATHCCAFKLANPEMVPPAKELRKLLRIQGLRCHAIYCQNGTKINVIPVLASRAQALRYLYVRWGVDLSRLVVFVGESGDTDYEELIGGVHKTVIVKGVCSGASKLHTNRNYPLEHVVPFDSPNLVKSEGCTSSNIKAALEKLGVLNG